MACKRSLSEEDLTCPICYDIFVDPVNLSCSHSLCKACMKNYWSINPSNQCPVCRRRSLINPPPTNLALKNLCESFIQERDAKVKELCSSHGEKLKLFCQEDRVPVCLVCWRSSRNKQQCCPIDEAASEYREQLKTTLNNLEGRLHELQIMERDCIHIAKHIKCQEYDTTQQIKKEFERLHQFLRDEEDARVVALEEEAKLRSNAISVVMGNIREEISTLSNTIQTTEEAVGSADIPFLQNIRSTIERAQCTPRDPENLSGSLINVAQHLGNLKFRVWEKMQDIAEYSPVILDPNTCQAKLVLSEDLTSVVNSAEKQRVPYNPERFDYYPCVLGSQSLCSGLHCWDVEVADSDVWSVGITTASNNRKDDKFFNENTWHVKYLRGEYTSHSPSEPESPLATERLQVLRVRLDWGGGEVSFSDPLSNKLLCTFRNVSREAVLPFLYNYCVSSPLKILPVRNSRA